MTTFRKTASPAARIGYEKAGLAWLTAAEGNGGAHVVPVLNHGPGWLEEPRLQTIPPTDEAARNFGRQLAFTHASGASHWGTPPDGWTGQGWMGDTDLILIRHAAHAPQRWGEFYAEYRILPCLDQASLSIDERALMERLCSRLSDGVFEHEQPSLVIKETENPQALQTDQADRNPRSALSTNSRKHTENNTALTSTGSTTFTHNLVHERTTQPVARLHGDLWSGNIMWTPEGGTLIDPAAQGGHAEEDLAQLALFGCSVRRSILDGYQEVSPLAHGWEERIGLHQLHMLIVHCVMFGRSYVGTTLTTAQRYL